MTKGVSGGTLRALWRALLALACLVPTVAAHAAAGGARPTPTFGLVCLSIATVAASAGPWRPPPRTSFPRMLALMLVGQAVAHVALTSAPWAFGLEAHHASPALSSGYALGHVLVAVWLAGLLALAEHLLAAALALLCAVRRMVIGTGRVGALGCPIDPGGPIRLLARDRAPARPRGPPLLPQR